MHRIEDGNHHASLESLATSITTDGSLATYKMKFTDQPPSQVSVPLEGVSSIIESLVETAKGMMRQRALIRNNSGGETLQKIETALRPSSVEVFVEPTSRDRILVFHFEDSTQKALKLTAFDAQLLQERLMLLTRRLSN